MNQPPQLVRNLYTSVLVLLCLGLPNLNLLMSIGAILLLILWFYFPGARAGFSAFTKNRLALALAGIFLIHILWLFNTYDFQYAVKDLRIKLPILLFPLVLSGINLTRNQIKIAFLALTAGIWVATLGAYFRYSQLPEGYNDLREIVQGVSHIRLGLLMVLQLIAFSAFWRELKWPWRIYFLISTINTLYFFNLVQSGTGIIAIGGVMVFSLIWLSLNFREIRVIRYVTASVFLFFFGIIGYAVYSYQNYYVSHESMSQLPAYTEKGNPYTHLTDVKIVENGNYTFLYLNREEMMTAWSERSQLSRSLTQVELEATEARLTRYLTSKGLRKDYAGVMALSDVDVSNIEKGFPSQSYLDRTGLGLRLHTFLFGWHVFSVTGDASGLSFFQRVVYWRVALNLIGDNFWLGTGTGDVKQEFRAGHQAMEKPLPVAFQNRAHNQFLTFFVAFGILGFAYFLCFFGFAYWQWSTYYLPAAFLFLAMLSCFFEDTLETQAGVTFFSFFFAVFLSYYGESKTLPAMGETIR